MVTETCPGFTNTHSAVPEINPINPASPGGPSTSIEDRKWMLRMAWKSSGGHQIRQQVRRRPKAAPRARPSRRAQIGRSIRAAQCCHAAALERQFRDAAVEPYLGAARLQGRDGRVNQCLRKALPRQHRDAGVTAAHQGLSHDDAKQTGETFFVRGVQRGDRQGLQQSPVKAACGACCR